jgi:predicted HAD superfamily Cof-like phosphohydrolase
MSDSDDDLRAQAAADGAEAQSEQALRDTEAWEVQMRNGNAAAEQIEANAVLLRAQAEQAESKAEVRQSLVHLVEAVTILLYVGAICYGITLLVGAFR